ncbi:MAG: DUF3048 domain-containing protein [Lapillicoccus sp.]
MMAGRSRRGAVGLTVVAVIGVLAACSSPPASTSPTTGATSSSSSTTSSPPPSATTPAAPTLAKLTGGPVLAAKIDNTNASRPRVGVGRADVVYVEPVEAGLTRLLCVWSSSMPPEIGPVRSGRESDNHILADYGRVAFAFSGASAGTLATLAQGTQVNLSFDASRTGFYRAGSRRAPYNVIGTTQTLLARAGGSVTPLDPGLRYGPALPGGTPGTSVETAWMASRIALVWDAGRKRYLVTTDGRPDIDADGTQHGAASVIVQVVHTYLSANRDVNGVQSPIAEVVGSGAATVLRDGRAWSGTWSRATPTAPTAYAIGGQDIPLAAGPVWILLVPQGQAASVH